MYECRVTADFAAAHFLRDYHGKCENLHGHNYKVYAHVRGSELDAGGMLVDFGQLKGALRTVLKKLDHTNLNDIAAFDQNPSAERIARFIYDEMLACLSAEDLDLSGKNGGTKLYAIDVFETETSRARFIAD
jgi:6-pyruvoyltetrahydropterin/6-carboxytetrahydropterin synthase